MLKNKNQSRPLMLSLSKHEASLKLRFSKLFIFIFLFINILSFDPDKIDRFIENSIKKEVFPGAVLLIGHDKDIIYHKAYGHFTYQKNSPKVTLNTIYDIASLTKVVATTTAAMLLTQANFLSPDDNVSKYLENFKTTDKAGIKIKDLLTHTSGLPTHLDTQIINQYKNDPEKILDIILNLEPIRPIGTFIYDCLNFIILKTIIEKITAQNFEEFVNTNIIKPIGMQNTMFNPTKKINTTNIAPTDINIQGTVHDPKAKIFNGVSGNAGLFSTTHDLYLFIQALTSSNNKFINKNIVETWTQNQIEIFNRGYGWATPPDKNNSCGNYISKNSFGHLGFTGTSIWYDKDKKVYVIFLSNRVYTKNGEWEGPEKIIEFRHKLHNKIFKNLN